MTIPMNSGLILIVEMRGACSASSARGSGIAASIVSRIDTPRPLRLLERGAHDLLRDAGDLDVHLQGGDPVPRAGHLEVHVTEVILGALDVGEDDVVVALLDEAHRDARDGRLDRDAGVHQRSVEPHTEPIDDEPFDSSVSETRRIVYGKSSTRRDDGLERALRERAVADVAPLRAAHEARLPDREGREVVVVHVAAVLLEREVVDPLLLLRRAERAAAS